MALIFDHSGYSNVIAKKRIDNSNIAIQAFDIELIQDLTNKRFKLLKQIQDIRFGQIYFVKDPENMWFEKKDLKAYRLKNKIGKQAA